MPHFQIAIVLLWREDRVLVQRRLSDAAHLPNVWEFPGGKCEEDESPRDCAIREAREELGVEIEIVSEREKINFEYSKDGSSRAVTLFPFDATIVEGEPQSLASSELRWMTPRAMQSEDFPAANKALLQDIQRENN